MDFFALKQLPHDVALTFGDVALPEGHSDIRSRSEISDFRTQLSPNLKLSIPFISANMESVTGPEMIIAVEREGGLGIIPQSIPVEEKKRILDVVKRADCARINDPLTINFGKTLREAKNLMNRFKIYSLVVVDEKFMPLGILSTRDWKYETDENKKVEELMSANLIKANHDIGFEEARSILRKNKIEKLPLVDKTGKLTSLITAHGLFYHMHYPRALRDENGQFIRVGSIGVGKTFKPEHMQDVELQINSGITALLIDTARAFSENTRDAIVAVKKAFPKLTLIVGNVSTPEGAKFLFESGADVVKVGQGPGEACRTREVGIGIPQLTAIAACSAVAKKFGKTVIADGGIKNPGDIVKAIIAGASAVMIGYLFAGTEESPPEPYSYYSEDLKADLAVKDYIGSASHHAQVNRIGKGNLDYLRRPEGIKRIVPVTGSLSRRVSDLLDGMRSAMSYLGARNLKELHEKGYFVPQTKAGHTEGVKRA